MKVQLYKDHSLLTTESRLRKDEKITPTVNIASVKIQFKKRSKSKLRPALKFINDESNRMNNLWIVISQSKLRRTAHKVFRKCEIKVYINVSCFTLFVDCDLPNGRSLMPFNHSNVSIQSNVVVSLRLVKIFQLKYKLGNILWCEQFKVTTSYEFRLT